MSIKQTTIEQKRALRRAMLERRDALDKRAERSAAIRARICGLPTFGAASAIHCFLSIRSEVDTRPLIAAALAVGKAVAVPVIVGGVLQHSWLDSLLPETLVAGVLGTVQPRQLRPAYPGEWGLTIVPLLAFDRTGYRLGYGKGYYDWLLAALPSCPAVGVGFAAQELPQVPHSAEDVALPQIATECELIVCAPTS